MRPSSKPFTAVIVAATLLAGAGRAVAATTTTTTATTTTTTTTTLQPHPFSAATASCVHDAYRAKKECRRTGGATCQKDFETAYSKCFAAGAGVSCAKKCVTKETTCFGAVPKTRSTCRVACHKTLVRDIRACRRIAAGDAIWASGDGSCLTTARANRDLCGFVCSQAHRDCHTALRFCVANCANL